MLLVSVFLVTILVPTSLAGAIGHNYMDHHDKCFYTDQAKAACSWLVELDSPYSDCMSLLHRNQIKKLYAMCRTKFCQHGMNEVCTFAAEVAHKCQNYLLVEVTGMPEGCYDMCPGGDKTSAYAACAWINDFRARTPYRACMTYFEDEDKPYFYAKCVAQYCMSGEAGMCSAADAIAAKCQMDFLFPIFDKLPQCENAQTTPPTVTPFPDGSHCDGDPDDDELAIEACAWIKDPNSPFAECYDSFNKDKRDVIYETCLKVYCYKGMTGVCFYADNLAGICKENFDLVITGRPKKCMKGFCVVDDPFKDPNAIAACAWVKDPNSAYAGCFIAIGKVDGLYEICVNAYCRDGIDGVCEFAMKWADKCEEIHDTCIDEPPIDCPVPDTNRYCYGDPKDNPDAHDACRWLVETDSPYHECMMELGCKEAHLLYQNCLEVYCLKGISGVCVYASYIAGMCYDKCERVVEKLDICDDVGDEQSFCEGDATEDIDAIEACSWLLDVMSPYQYCLQSMDADPKKKFMYCVHTYCKYGAEGVCKIAQMIADWCPEPPEKLAECGGCSIGTAMKNNDAVAACEWVFDHNSAFHVCVSKQKPGDIKKWYQRCLLAYCNYGQDGVCNYAKEMAYQCVVMVIPIFGSYDDLCPVPTTTEKIECDASNAGTNEHAIAACSWVIDEFSPFHWCVSKLGLEETKKWYQDCLLAFCEMGQDGVCDYAHKVASTCKNEHNTHVGSYDDLCQPGGKKTTMMCSENDAGTNVHAIVACSWVIDVDSNFHDCVSSQQIEVIKEWYQACLLNYCYSGLEGVCNYADHLAHVCETQNKPVPDHKDVCTPTTTEPPTTVFSFCVDAPEVDENAAQACQWLSNTSTKFYECFTGFESYHPIFYTRCVESYCYSGLYGACLVAMDIANKCEQYLGICISDPPDACGNPEEHKVVGCDKKAAKKKCSFIIERKSLYYDCLKSYGCEALKEIYNRCVDDYCMLGDACRIANALASECGSGGLPECR